MVVVVVVVDVVGVFVHATLTSNSNRLAFFSSAGILAAGAEELEDPCWVMHRVTGPSAICEMGSRSRALESRNQSGKRKARKQDDLTTFLS